MIRQHTLLSIANAADITRGSMKLGAVLLLFQLHIYVDASYILYQRRTVVALHVFNCFHITCIAYAG